MTAAAQATFEIDSATTFTPSDGAAGRAVALSADGTRAIIGSPGDDYAHVFVRGSAGWREEARLVPSVAERGSFGSAVALSRDGACAAVGAPFSDGVADEGGAVTVFAREGSEWSLVATLTSPDAEAHDFFGAVVALSATGDRLVVGAPGDDDERGTDSGSVRVFVRAGGSWIEEALLRPSVGTDQQSFGGSVAISADGSRIAVGTRSPVLVGVGSLPSAHVFVRDASWREDAALPTFGSHPGDSIGHAVSMDAAGRLVLVGAHTDSIDGKRSGSARTFRRASSGWMEEASLTPSDGAPYAFFGIAVALSPDGTRALIGAPGDSTPLGGRSGSARLFVRVGARWAEDLTLLHPMGEPEDFFGNAVSLSAEGTTALVGDWGDDVGGLYDAGSATLFELRLLAACPTGGCASGFCVDGVCCNAGCGGGAVDDCLACAASLTGRPNGECGRVLAELERECRPSTGTCDAPETCTGDIDECPADDPVRDGTACEDGLMCQSPGTCVARACVGSTPTSCDDDDPCTEDACSEPAGCTHVARPDCRPDAASDLPDGSEFGRDAGLAWPRDASGPRLDASTAADGGPAPGGGSCGCRAGGTRGMSSTAALALVLLWCARRHRSRRLRHSCAWAGLVSEIGEVWMARSQVLVLLLASSGCSAATDPADGGGTDASSTSIDASTRDAATGSDAVSGRDDAAHLRDASIWTGTDAPDVDAPPRDVATLPDAPLVLDPGPAIACTPWCVDGVCDPPVQIATGPRQTVALRAGGTVVVWGAVSPTPTVVPGIDDGVEVSAGEGFTCVRRASGSVACVGANRLGQLGRGLRSEWGDTWGDVVGVTDAVELVSGRGHSCVRHRSGGVSCWGSDWSGQLGDRRIHELFVSPSPVSVDGPPGVIQLAAGSESTCGRLASGAVECWGSGFDGRIGDGSVSSDDRDTPVAVVGISTAVDLTSGASHSHATLADGTIMSWGRADDSELGVGWPPPEGPVAAPIASWLLAGLTGIAGGSNFSCGFGAPGIVACWGTHPGPRPADYLLLGPTVVRGITDAMAVRGGDLFACVLRACGDVVCWGANDVGQLGNGTRTHSETPTAVLVPSG